MDEVHEKEKMNEFLEIAFNGLNKIAYRLALSIELNKQVSREAFKALHGEYAPD